MSVPASANPGAAYVRLAPEPILPPPLLSRGAIAWARANLFSSPLVECDHARARRARAYGCCRR